MKQIILIILVIFSSGQFAAAQIDEYRPERIYRIFSENDFFLFRDRTDIYYTQGLKLEFLKKPRSDHKLNDFWPFLFKSGNQDIIGLTLGQNMYTPGDVTTNAISEDDRPYAGWLYVGLTTISNRESSSQRMTADLHFGVIGPIALGEPVQRGWHALINASDPQGWDHQIANEAGINLNLKYEIGLLSYLSSNKSLAFDFIPTAEILAGSVFNKMGIGTSLRISFLNSSRYFANPIDSTGKIPSLLKENSRQEGQDRRKPTFKENFQLSNISLFTRTSVRAVLWNSLLQGGVFNPSSPYTISSRDMERFYFDMDYGVTYSTPYFNISYSRAYRTKEFKQQPNSHQWGQFYLTLKF